jgi:electron-transferring-flavoprotein dehydrogenase
MTYDILIIGAGPAGLAAATRLKQLAEKSGHEISVCVLEKGAEVGAHILSGAVIDPVALDELIPDWEARGAPLKTRVTEDHFYIFSERRAREIPQMLLPPLMHNKRAYIGSLGELCRWLAQQAEALGVEIYAGFAAQEVLYDERHRVVGVITGDMGRNAAGEETPQFAPGIEIRAKYTLIAEGVRGSLTRQLEEKFDFQRYASPQKYGLGFKEIWRVTPEKHRPGRVEHSLGWPLTADTGGGSFVYHYGENLVAVGFVVHLDYANPYLSPFGEFQRFKMHPRMRELLQGGQRLSYGARAISEGGMQSWEDAKLKSSWWSRLTFPGGALIGCSAGMVNVPRIKGTHNAMKSGMLAAEAAFDACVADHEKPVQGGLDGAGFDEHGYPEMLADYHAKLRASWVYRDLYAVRNVKPWLSRFGTWGGMLLGGFEMWLAALGLYMPWTLRHRKADHECTQPAAKMPKMDYPKPDGIITFDRLSSIALSNIAHHADQPCHVHLKDAAEPVQFNLLRYDAPEQRYCPAGVYEIEGEGDAARLRINAQNCIHCKSCDIKEVKQNIVWTPPEGGSGPTYSAM